MGTITTRVGKSGLPRYTAQIRLKRAGRITHSEAQTFANATRAREWLRNREFELRQQPSVRASDGPRSRAKGASTSPRGGRQQREISPSSSPTLAALIAEFGSGQILLERCCHYFGMKPEEAKRVATRQLLPLPVFRLGSQKSPWMISTHQLAQYIDAKCAESTLAWKRIHAIRTTDDRHTRQLSTPEID